jgi:hypothetical protein
MIRVSFVINPDPVGSGISCMFESGSGFFFACSNPDAKNLSSLRVQLMVKLGIYVFLTACRSTPGSEMNDKPSPDPKNHFRVKIHNTAGLISNASGVDN